MANRDGAKRQHDDERDDSSTRAVLESVCKVSQQQQVENEVPDRRSFKSPHGKRVLLARNFCNHPVGLATPGGFRVASLGPGGKRA